MIKTILLSTITFILLSALGASLYSSARASNNLLETNAQAENEVQVSNGNHSAPENRGSNNQSFSSEAGKIEQSTGFAGNNSSDLTVEEIEGLLFMLEEEKLARDVYAALYAAWQIPVFSNISASEQSHMEAIAGLINKYSLDGPVLSEPGIFNDPDLQTLYNDLVARGTKSVSEALKVGGAIEEIDILDLQYYLSLTDNADIYQVYNNLLRGSENHLRAFTNILSKQTSETYQPQYLTMEQYETIAGQSFQGNGNGYRGNGIRGNKGFGSGSN